MVKDAADFARCTAIIQTRFADLKSIYVNLMAGDNYPHIGLLDFSSFCRDVGILDGSIPTHTVDRMFLATKAGAPSVGAGNALFRHEFLEILIRIANTKYRESGKADTFSEALEMMLNSVLANFKAKPWQIFRDDQLWTNEVDALFSVNLDLIQKVHESITPNYTGTDEGFRNCLDIVTRGSDIELSEKEARFCFGMSKMTVKDEMKNHQEYDKLRFAEFLEFLGRVA